MRHICLNYALCYYAQKVSAAISHCRDPSVEICPNKSEKLGPNPKRKTLRKMEAIDLFLFIADFVDLGAISFDSLADSFRLEDLACPRY